MICAVIRHPSLKEGQTALARGFLKVLGLIYSNVHVIDTAQVKAPEHIFYLQEGARVLMNSCDTIHLLNVTKPLITFINMFTNKELITYQFSHLPTIHGLWRLKRTAIERGSRVVVGTSRRIAGLFNNGVFTYPPVDTKLFRPRDRDWARGLFNLPRDRPIVGYVGDVDVKRGFDIVVRTALRLAKYGVKTVVTSLRIDNATPELVRDLRRAVKDEALIVLGREVPVWYLYNVVDALLLPIRGDYPTEPPMTLIEALASGTPVIGSDSPSMADYRDLYVVVRDEQDYTDAVLRTLNDKDVHKELAIKCREFTVNNLSHNAVASKLSRYLL
jgi:glycosyltransferase involved in cell wall biosynthesis